MWTLLVILVAFKTHTTTMTTIEGFTDFLACERARNEVPKIEDNVFLPGQEYEFLTRCIKVK
jgi:hypothetical protein